MNEDVIDQTNFLQGRIVRDSLGVGVFFCFLTSHTKANAEKILIAKQC